jgi:hypothetical protein
MSITYYELKNVILASEYTKSRKVLRLRSLRGISEIDPALLTRVLTEILDGEKESEVFDRLNDEDRLHWIEHFSKLAASDLLTLGKVQPETMVQMMNLPREDFEEVILKTTLNAREVNKITIDVERTIQVDIVPTEMV